MTKVIADQNCTGKTKKLIRESLNTGNPILALTPTKAQSLKEKSLSYFGETVKVITFPEVRSYQGKILIDDLDEIISELLKQSLDNNGLEVSAAVINI